MNPSGNSPEGFFYIMSRRPATGASRACNGEQGGGYLIKKSSAAKGSDEGLKFSYNACMTFMRTDSTAPVCDALARRIAGRLHDDTPVLFLVSGGSTASIAVDTCNELKARFARRPGILKRLLTVSLVDERFGCEGHSGSNWRLLLETGLRVADARTIPVLENSTGADAELEIVTSRFDAFLAEATSNAARGTLFIAGLFGIGADGHTAGILPGSPPSMLPVADACVGRRGQYAAGYRSEHFSRITVTPAFFPHIDFAAAYAAGSAKWPALAELLKEKPVREQPAQLLRLPKETTIFSDRIP